MAQGLCKRAILILAFGMNVGVSNWPLNGASLSATGESPLAVPNEGVLPKWSNGVLITVAGLDSTSPVVLLYDRSGVRTSAIPFGISGSVRMSIYDFDRGVDGTVGLVGYATDADGRSGSFVATISPDGSVSHTTRTSPYSPRHVAVAPDGTLWTEGRELINSATIKADGKTHHTVADYVVPGAGSVRHFDKAGKQVGAFLAQSTYHVPEGIGGNDNFLRVSADRAVVYSGRDQRFVEIPFDGSTVTDISVALPAPNAVITGIAVNEAGDVYISEEHSQQGNKHLGICVFDRKSRSWVMVRERAARGDPNDFYGVYGADQAGLVLSSANGLRMKFFALVK